MRLSIVIAMMASFLIIAPSGAREKQPADAAVLELVHAFSNARTQFDAKTLDMLLTTDYVEVSPRGEVDRRPVVLSFYLPSKAAPAPPMTLQTQDVRQYGDTAIVIGSVEYAVPGPGGATAKRTVRVTYVERRVAGRWLMAATQYTSVQPPQQVAH